MKVTLEEVEAAQKKLKHIALKTPLTHSPWLTQLYGKSGNNATSNIYIKFENSQITGSFKLRGAYTKISSLNEEEKKRGVIASSAGNHAMGVAHSAQLLGIKCTIVMPERASIVKVENTRALGAKVVLYGEVYDDAYKKAREIAETEGLVFIHPFEDSKVVSGQATLGLEIAEDLPSVDTVIVPIGGGGLISGMAQALAYKKPGCRIIGVQSEQTPSVYQMYYNQPVEISSRRITTIADGIAVKRPSEDLFHSFIKPFVHQVVTVTDDEIAEAIVGLLERHKSLAEGSGAAALAALMNRSLDLGENVCVLVSGGNIDLNIINKVLQKGQVRRGRLVEISVIVEDLPGSLSQLAKVISDHGANVLDVHHDRVSGGLYLRETLIEFVVETIGHDHSQKIKEALKRIGARIV